MHKTDNSVFSVKRSKKPILNADSSPPNLASVKASGSQSDAIYEQVQLVPHLIILFQFEGMSKVSNRQAINNEIKHSMALLLHPDATLQQQAQRNAHQRTLTISSHHIHREIQILAWRFKTSLPIVRPLEYTLSHNSPSPAKNNHLATSPPITHMPDKSFQRQSTTQLSPQIYCPREHQTLCEIRMKIEEIKCRLSDVGLLPFSQILYLLKQMMIGYDILIDKFGTFSPSEHMVVVTQALQWKVWINEDFFKNSKEEDKSCEIGVKEFIYCLILLAQKHCASTSQSKLFFNDVKEWTYGNSCGFVKVLEKMKDFALANKIFQANKVILPLEQLKKTKEQPCNQQRAQEQLLNRQNSMNNESFQAKKPASHMQLDKKLSVQQMPSHYGFRSPTYAGNSNNSSFNFIEHQNNKRQSYIPQPLTTSSFQLQQTRSQKFINGPGFYYTPAQSNPLSIFQKTNSKTYNTNEQQPINSYQLNRNFNGQRKKMGYSYLPAAGQRKVENVLKSPEIRSKPQSPEARQLQNKNTLFSSFTKSRQQLKNLVNKKTEQSSGNLLKLPMQSRMKQRKYSQQVFKAKSVDVLAKVAKKIYGSNIYEQDPQIKQNGVNVIKINVKKANYPPSKKNTDNPQPNQRHFLSGFKGPDSGTPNNSSNSTQELQNSRERAGNKQPKYEYLKANDLDKGRIRNNQSSCYGMGGYTEQQKRQKNMVVSCSFRNRDEHSSKSQSREKEQKVPGNNWTKKISGLFSDDASIKHLKGSVKFKTNEEQRFQKEYLKDVKLQMLEKFGRPVRHSIVDEQQDFGPSPRNPYKSMQLIEQAVDEGRSYVEKDDQVQQQMPIVRGRHQTVQVYKKQGDKQAKIQHRQCVSYECSERDSDQDFNFESQGYVIFKK